MDKVEVKYRVIRFFVAIRYIYCGSADRELNGRRDIESNCAATCIYKAKQLHNNVSNGTPVSFELCHFLFCVSNILRLFHTSSLSSPSLY